MRLKLTLEYDGSGFHGWAAQPDLRTVEGVVRAGLEEVFPSSDKLTVAGRTDTGVHALANVASVEVEGGPPPERAADALNAALPDDVSVLFAASAAPDFHARHSARWRSYRYRIWRRRAPSPFEQRRAWWVPRPLEEERLADAADLLVGEHDFRAFTPTETQHSSSRSRRTASSGTWCERSSGRCSSSRRSVWRSCWRADRAARPARRRRRGGCTSPASVTRTGTSARG